LGEALTVAKKSWRNRGVNRQVVAGVSKSNASNWQETDLRR